jgi:hypothetical protein
MKSGMKPSSKYEVRYEAFIKARNQVRNLVKVRSQVSSFCQSMKPSMKPSSNHKKPSSKYEAKYKTFIKIRSPRQNLHQSTRLGMKPSSKYEAFVKMPSHVKLSFFIEKMKKIAKPLFKCEEFIKKRKEKEESLSPRLAMYRGQRAQSRTKVPLLTVWLPNTIAYMHARPF